MTFSTPATATTTKTATLGSTGNDTIVYSDSGPTAYQKLTYNALDTGITATINGATNIATVDKGTSGFDTIVDIANPLNATKEPPYGGFGLVGTDFDDHFDLTLADGLWMNVRGEGGNDTINIHSGNVIISYRHTLGDVDVDLSAGKAHDDGHGNIDTITGRVGELEGGLGNDILRGTDGGDRLDGGPGNDVLYPQTNNYRDASDHVYGSFGNDRIHFGDTREGAVQQIYYDPHWRTPRFTEGIEVTFDGPSNSGTVDKGSAGIDTFVDVRTPMSLADGGFSIEGTRFDDVFTVTLGEGHWLGIAGDAGNDTINFYSNQTTGRLGYSSSPNGIDIDVAAGKTYDDGYGDEDTFSGTFWEIRGSDFSDVIRGTDNGESFDGRGGNDTIDGRGGFDRVRYDRSQVAGVTVDLEEGTAVGTWDGHRFTHTLSNIEHVRGSNGNDDLFGSSGDDRIDGRRGDDVIEGRAGNDALKGEGGADLFVFGRGHGEDSIEDFTDGEDRILFEELDLNSKDDVLDNAHAWDEGVGVWIDLRPYGGGTLSISGLPRGDFDKGDFLF